MVVTGTYDPYLVALSILVASFASYTALDLGGHVAAARGLARRVWLSSTITLRVLAIGTYLRLGGRRRWQHLV